MAQGGLGRGLSSLIPNLTPFNANQNNEASQSEDFEKVIQIPLTQIESNPYQPREDFSYDQLEELVESIKKHGILQPLIVSKKPTGGYQLIAGERRFRASEILELKTVPAIVRSAADIEKLELALIENLQRQNLNPIEEAKAYQRLIEEFDLSQEEASLRVGKKRATVANFLRLLDLPPEIQQALADRKISTGHAKVILSAETEKERLKLYQKIISSDLTVRGVEQEARKIKVKGHDRRMGKNPEILDQEDRLRKALNTKVAIKAKGQSGEITIEYYSSEELNSLIEKITRD